MGNSAGAFAVLAAFARPGLVVPHVMVPDISHIDWKRLRHEGGVEHVVIDKDNCIALPLRDEVAPQLRSAWQALTQAGFRSILIVSNSAGSSDDPLAIGAEHVARNFGVPVLAHPAKKPAIACARQVVEELRQTGEGAASTSGHVAVIGDRVTTDIVLAMRVGDALRRGSAAGSGHQSVGILCTGVLEHEKVGTRILRAIEMWSTDTLFTRGIEPGGGWRRSNVEAEQSSRSYWTSVAVHGDSVAAIHTPQQVAEEEAATLAPADVRSPAETLYERARSVPNRSLLALGRAGRVILSFLGNGWQLINDGIRIGTNGHIGASHVTATNPRDRHATLDRLARRPYQRDQPNPFLRSDASSKDTPPSLSAKSSPAARRLYGTQTAPQSIPKPKMWFRPIHLLGVIGCVVVVPGGIVGGVWLKRTRQRIALREELDAAARLQTAPVTDEPVHTPADVSLADQRSVGAIRFKLRNEVADIDERLAVLRTRQQRRDL